MADVPPDDVIVDMLDLLEQARPMMVEKCCHYDWCIERRGIVTDDPHLGWREIVDGMHPGCVAYRYWVDSVDRLAGLR